MASFITPVDRLINNLELQLPFIDSHGSGTFEQVSAYFLQTATNLNKFLQNAPVRIRKIVASQFTAIGYDLIKARPVTRGSITMPHLKVCLVHIIEGLRNLNHAVPEPTTAELADVALGAARLWDLDSNRLIPQENFVLDLQKEKSPSDKRDYADRPLFESVDAGYLERPTFKAFITLLNNYSADEGHAEVVTAEERTENERFLNLCLDTAPMQYAHKWLAAHKKVPADRDGFLTVLYNAWFGLYRRKAANDSSGFEHVFLGERDGDKCVGLHNWVQLRNEEIAGRLNYKGKIRPKRRVPLNYPAEQLVTIQFVWCGVEKFMSTSLVGTSPEFEIALYSICFFFGQVGGYAAG